MRKCSSPARVVALISVLGAGLAGCDQIGMLKGKIAYKEANTLYRAQNWAAASKKYEETIAQGCGGGECKPAELTYSYFFLANSYDQQFRPTKRGEAENDAFMEKAIEFYGKAAEEVPDPEYRKRSLQYQALAYGVDKLNEPDKAEPILERLISLDPNDATNYYQLARLYEDKADYAKAEESLIKARDVRPNDPDVYAQLAHFYETRGLFDKQMEALYTRAEKEPNSPEAHYTIANVYWNKACLPSRPQCVQIAAKTDALKAKYIKAGMESADKALTLRDDYIDALVFKGLLLRSQAWLEKNEPARAALIREAEQISDKVREIQKRQSGAGSKTSKTSG